MLSSRNLTRRRGLTETEKETYARDGLLVLREVFLPDEIAELASDVDAIARDFFDLIDSKNMRIRFSPHHQTGEPLFEKFDPVADLSPVARSITCDRRLLDSLADIYGEPAELFKDKLIYKPAGATGASLHQDWISWPGFPESFVTVLVAIDPFTSENGATEFFLGRHRDGYLSAHDGQHHVLRPEDLAEPPVVLELSPGDVAIFSCFTPHRSAPNLSCGSRRGYFVSYNARSDGGQQYLRHYREYHQWIQKRASADSPETLYFR